MFRAVCRSSSGAPTVFTASGLHTRVVIARSQVWVGTGLVVTACSQVWVGTGLVVTVRSQVWVGTGLGTVPFVVDQVVTCVCIYRHTWLLDQQQKARYLSQFPLRLDYGRSPLSQFPLRLDYRRSPLSQFPLRLDYGRSPHAYVNQRL